jgi:hypothetical protein
MITRRTTLAGLAGSALVGTEARAAGKPLVIVTSYAG